MTQRGDTLEFPVTSPGATKAADDINRVGDSMTKGAKQWDNYSQKSAKATAALGALGNALGPLGANFGILGQSVSRATGIISSMTSLLGGPWAIAIGAAAIGLGVLAKKFADAKDKADELRESMRAQWAEDVDRERKRRADARSQYDVDKRNAEAGTASFLAGEMAAGNITVGGKGGKKKGGRGGGGFRPSDPLFGEASDFTESDPFAESTQTDENRDAVAAMNAEFDKAEKDAALERERAHLEGIEAMRQGQMERDIARMEEVRRLEEQKNEFISGMLEDQGRLAIRAANEAAKGHAMGKKAALQSIGDALVARGTSAIAEGGIWSSVPFMWGSGAPMIAMGLTAIGVGVGMGAASRAIPAGGSGGGKSTGTPQLAPATPVALDRTGGNAGPTTIVVNVPTVLSASGADGQRIAMSIEQARREGRI